MASRLSTYAAFGLVLVLTVLLAVWGAFLVPLRVGETVVPVCWLVAAAGNGLLGTYGGRLLGRLGAGLAGVLWLGIALTLGTKRGEGDLVVPGSTTGLVFLLVGAVASAVAYGVTSPGGRTGRSPERGDR
ncbi:MAG: hypothetical protein JWM62_477 [Frankiales bacterium]|nr:hypothetical protein [Frankiales bacterium]